MTEPKPLTMRDVLSGTSRRRELDLQLQYEHLHRAHFERCDRWKPFKKNSIVPPRQTRET